MTVPRPVESAPALASALTDRLLAGDFPLEPLTPEAGTRRYFRSLDPRARGWLLVRSPAPPPDQATSWMEEAGVRVPRLGARVDGAYLVEDCGDRHLAHAPNPGAYAQVLQAWEAWSEQVLPDDHPNAGLALDEELFLRELKQFREDYVQAFRKRAWAPPEAARIDASCRELAQAATQGPWCVQHRDLHSRNVILTEDDQVVIIDHQDLRRGPLYYDLASLRTDAYVDPPAAVLQLLDQHVDLLAKRFDLAPAEARGLEHATAVQRVLKALGTFGRLIGMGRSDYRSAERRARGHALRLLRADSPFSAFEEWLA